MSLRQYLQLAYEEARLTSDADLNAIQYLEAVLKRDEENMILVYGGSFNPPHRGHLDVLLSGLRPELEAAAIVILPSEDYHLRNKVTNSYPDFFLHQKRRADIWNALPGIPKTKVWVWTNTWFPFRPFLKAFYRATAADGFRVSFTNMIGPDNLNLREPLRNPPYSFHSILVTNKARHCAAHFTPSGEPVRWNGFGEWSRHTYWCGKGDEKGKDEEAILWTCKGIGHKHVKTGYYLQYAHSVPTNINSTSLRKALIQKHVINESNLNQLSTQALVELLAPILLSDEPASV